MDIEWDPSIDDVTLSQIGNDVEREIMFDDMSDMTISQALDTYQVDTNDITDLPVAEFELKYDILHEEASLISPCDDLNEICRRFAPPTSVSDAAQLISDTESKNTRKNTSWAVSVFDQWRQERKEEIPHLKDFDVECVNTWFARFVMEARKKDGSPYPPKTLYSIMAGLLRSMREQGVYINFLDPQNSVCSYFQKVLSAQMTKLTSQGYGTSIKQAEPLSEESEKLLWDKGLFGDSSAKSLVNTVFFYNCKLFGLRACDEHRALEASQISVGTDQHGEYIEFRGKTSKNFKGGLNHRHVEAKSIRHHSNSSDLPRLYTTYLQKIGNEGPFYRRPIVAKGHNDIQFSSQVIGVNKLSKLMKDMCSEAGIQGNFTNHSGKRTCATRLYSAGIEEQEIMRITGHRSIEAVRKYKRPSQTMLSEISNQLDPPKRMKMETSESAVREPVNTPSEPVNTPSARQENDVGPSANVVYQNCIFNF